MTTVPETTSPELSVLDVWADPQRTLPFFKGRVALFGLLRAAGVGPGDEVVVPGFTCVVVPAAILYTGAKPVFYEIIPSQLNGDPEDALAKITERTKVVLVQHTFGVPAELGLLPQVCRKRGITLIEDCAHALGASIDGRQIGTLGDAAFASLQWSKPITTGLGGIARVNNDRLWAGLQRFHDEECADPTWKEEAFLNLTSALHARFFRPSLFWFAQSVYRRLGALGIVKGSSDRCELVAPETPGDYAKRFGRRRGSRLSATLATLPEVIEHRRKIAEIYHQELRGWGIPLQEEPEGASSVPLRIPIRVRDREGLLQEARHHRVELGDWFNAPLHPGESPQGAFGYTAGSCPHAEQAARELVNLPTHPGVDERAAIRTLEFLSGHRESFLQDSNDLQGVGR